METRLLAILLTDASGYTEFSSQADHQAIENAVRQQQRIIPPLVEKHQGRLVKWIGDAALVVFSSATEALLCGREIQQSFVEHGERSETSIKPRI